MQSPSTLNFSFPYVDKVIHFVCYFIFSLVLYLYSIATILGKEESKFRFIFVLGIGSFIGLSLEIAQAQFTLDRLGEWTDFCFNSIGLISAFLMMESLKHKSVL